MLRMRCDECAKMIDITRGAIADDDKSQRMLGRGLIEKRFQKDMQSFLRMKPRKKKNYKLAIRDVQFSAGTLVVWPSRRRNRKRDIDDSGVNKFSKVVAL